MALLAAGSGDDQERRPRPSRAARTTGRGAEIGATRPDRPPSGPSLCSRVFRIIGRDQLGGVDLPAVKIDMRPSFPLAVLARPVPGPKAVLPTTSHGSGRSAPRRQPGPEEHLNLTLGFAIGRLCDTSSQVSVPPAGFEPATLGLGRATKSPAVAVTRALEPHRALLHLLWWRWYAVVHPPTHPPRHRRFRASPSVGFVLGREDGEQLREVFGDRLPEDVEVDVEVVVDEAVAHAGGGAPGDRGHRCPAFGADTPGGLADDLDELGQCEPKELVMIEITALLALAVADGLGRGVVQVA